MPRPKPHYRLVVSNLQSVENRIGRFALYLGTDFPPASEWQMGPQGAGRQQDDRLAAVARLVGVALNNGRTA